MSITQIFFFGRSCQEENNTYDLNINNFNEYSSFFFLFVCISKKLDIDIIFGKRIF